MSNDRVLQVLVLGQFLLSIALLIQFGIQVYVLRQILYW